VSKNNLFSHATVYFLFFVNTVYATGNGFNWLYWISAALVFVMIILDIVEVIKHGRK